MNTKVRIDAKGKALGNVFLKEYKLITECKYSLAKYFNFYDYRREHSKSEYAYQMNVYLERSHLKLVA
jgi:hypothetical protein